MEKTLRFTRLWSPNTSLSLKVRIEYILRMARLVKASSASIFELLKRSIEFARVSAFTQCAFSQNFLN